MTERKKPGPKPKCKECGRKEGEGHYDDCPVGMGVVAEPSKAGDVWVAAGGGSVNFTVITTEDCVRAAAQAYAMRVWSGQSPDVPRKERIARCVRALEGQNLPTEGIEYP